MVASSEMQAGKLHLDLLSEMLGKLDIRDPRVVLGPRPGEDAALIDFGDRYLVAKSDPITFATDLIGWYVVQVNANDLAVMGATPRWFMATLLLPEGSDRQMVESIFDHLSEACREHDVTLVGGHTEVTYDLPRPIVAGTMLGEVEKDRVVLTSGARSGDSIVLTKGIAVEGTAILAREASDALTAAGVTEDTLKRAGQFLFEPGISVRKEAVIACEAGAARSMHDPTEGGLATGLLEMAAASGLGLQVDAARIPVLPECRQLCDALGLDPMGLIASGALLAGVPPERAAGLIDALAGAGIEAWEIGRFTEPSAGLKLKTESGTEDLPKFERDELARYFGSQLTGSG